MAINNNEVQKELREKDPETFTREDMDKALKLAKSTQRIDEKVLYTSVKHHVKQNEQQQQGEES
ncbi:hypothetical protein CEH05_20505 (plasmid) [Halobacillus halophilus]|uniref:Uncharacterized protein n=1 Tax=Halobacillus halophilus (strain ATCC 35676 / DSM 2266 / JCM 20832 / KCTC 3685 / LMG 17431 / NBRC 102448 / NCIMB 2269) TaxID=866895 RepID=I0JTN9_HALH3|nr:hypothetical protein [Halobacillus halophilus]ASF41575.1 hypothetical protein CEH05_20505 [Halobacillus halophilus]CCG47512.1 hypothetical protein HBHAL_6002 [Halobacillus halophilus DSM 2266]